MTTEAAPEAMAMPASDLTLLDRFVSHQEEAAFVALVKRHGPRVQGTCRRVLRNEHDVEEVYQATFLLLARKAAVVAWRDSVGGWLCAVAYRLALAARADASRHQRREASFGTLAAAGVPAWGQKAGCPIDIILSLTHSSISNVGICVRSSTPSCCNCPKSTGRRSSCATSKVEPIKRPPNSSAGPQVRFLAGFCRLGPS